MPDQPILAKKVIGTSPYDAILMTAPFQITQKVIKFAAGKAIPMPRHLRQAADSSFPMPPRPAAGSSFPMPGLPNQPAGGRASKSPVRNPRHFHSITRSPSR